MRILVLCTGNSARSQMAEGLLRVRSSYRLDVCSAGTRPKGLNPLAVKVMNEIGIDISHHSSKDVCNFQNDRFDWVITVCDRAKEECPVFPASKTLHWSFEDPQDLESFRTVRDQISARVDAFLKEILD